MNTYWEIYLEYLEKVSDLWLETLVLWIYCGLFLSYNSMFWIAQEVNEE